MQEPSINVQYSDTACLTDVISFSGQNQLQQIMGDYSTWNGAILKLLQIERDTKSDNCKFKHRVTNILHSKKKSPKQK